MLFIPFPSPLRCCYKYIIMSLDIRNKVKKKDKSVNKYNWMHKDSGVCSLRQK